ncbi:hypothetical protein PT277_04465 [Acetobacteraceae bacterium ESL0709]|nr:hypothetical protein [Acetobacteraceae bacterium ESL0697]MDF7677951.1 hypothetical protein [Acetobacteraceae bacterium ESL0709]
MINVSTFGPEGGNVLYKALSHPLAVGPLEALQESLKGQPVAVYDPDHYFETFIGLYPDFEITTFLTHQTEKLGQPAPFGKTWQALLDLPDCKEKHVLVLSFEKAKMQHRLSDLLGDRQLYTLEPARLPEKFLQEGLFYLDKCNFATNFAFFRDNDQFSTRLTTANYWSNYAAHNVTYWFQLFGEAGQVLAQWEEPVETAGASVIVDSRAICRRFGLSSFTGQLFVHVIGARGHDVVKYALDTIGHNGNPSLSVTHDANAWPSDRFGSLPAPAEDETLLVWLQNSHGVAIPAGSLAFRVMGTDDERIYDHEMNPYETVALDLGKLFPDVRWPAQFEMRAGKYLVRPRYEISEGRRTRIAHLNVMRADLRPDEALSHLHPSLGRGILLPFPILPPEHFETFLQPNPMSETVETLPLRVDLFDHQGQAMGSHFLGNLKRNHKGAVAIHDLVAEAGHGELVYDFREGGIADGWLHAMMRYHNRCSDHKAETSFGGHIFNTLMTWRNEPQSYSGPAPGLTTRLFLKLGLVDEGRQLRTFCQLIYPCSGEKRPPSVTVLYLYAKDGSYVTEKTVSIKASGSMIIYPDAVFSEEELKQAGQEGHIIIRDLTCRLFGYHGVENEEGGFSLDHMFGF